MKKQYIYIILCLLFLISTTDVEAKKRKPEQPLPYTIATAHVARQRKHRAEIQWYQPIQTLIVVYKLSETRGTFDDCGWIEDNYKAPYCKVIFTRRGLVGNMRIRDNNYRKGDEYYILQYVYPTHNGAYGPFVP